MPRHKSLAQFELFVLQALVHCRGKAFTTDIQETISARAGRGASLGAVYTALARLETRGFVRHEVTKPRPIQGGKSRKRFAITSAGSAALAEALDQLRRMLEGAAWDLAPRST